MLAAIDESRARAMSWNVFLRAIDMLQKRRELCRALGVVIEATDK